MSTIRITTKTSGRYLNSGTQRLSSILADVIRKRVSKFSKKVKDSYNQNVIKKGIKYVERKIVEPDLFILDKQVVDKVGDIKTDVKTKDADDNLPKGNLDLNQGKDEESENIEQNIENKDSKKYDHENYEID